MDKSNIQRLAVADGRTHMSTKVPQCPVKIGTYNDKVDFYSAPIIYDLILGKPWLAKHNPSINWRTNEIKFSTKDGRRHRWIAHESWSHQNNDTLNLTLSSMQLKRLAKKKDTQMYICLLKDGTEVNHTPKVNLEGTPKYMQKLVQEYSQVFKEIDGPPPRRVHDHQIKTIHDAPPPWRNLYHMSPEELMVLKEELQRLLKIGHIRRSISPYGAPVFFVKQKDKLRMVIDYRALNKITIMNRTAIPNMIELLDRLWESVVFTAIDLQSGYHQIGISAEDIHKTAFRTKYGHYEWLVLPFGLCNSPATFQSLMNDIFSDIIDIFVIVYIDDILIFSKSHEDHERHLRIVFDRLQKHQL